VFVGIMSVYSFVAGWLVVLAELRFSGIKRLVLVHFAFLSHFMGRFLFYTFLGTMLLAVGHIGPRIVGGFLIASGCCQLFISILVSKDILPYSAQDDSIDGLFGGNSASTASSKKGFGQSIEPDTSWAKAPEAPLPADDGEPPAPKASRQDRASRAASVSRENPLASAGSSSGSGSAVADTPGAVDAAAALPAALPSHKAEPVEPKGGTADNPWG